MVNEISNTLPGCNGAVPAILGAVVAAYLLVAPDESGISALYGQISGICIAFDLMIWFLVCNNSQKRFANVQLPGGCLPTRP